MITLEHVIDNNNRETWRRVIDQPRFWPDLVFVDFILKGSWLTVETLPVRTDALLIIFWRQQLTDVNYHTSGPAPHTRKIPTSQSVGCSLASGLQTIGGQRSLKRDPRKFSWFDFHKCTRLSGRGEESGHPPTSPHTTLTGGFWDVGAGNPDLGLNR